MAVPGAPVAHGPPEDLEVPSAGGVVGRPPVPRAGGVLAAQELEDGEVALLRGGPAGTGVHLAPIVSADPPLLEKPLQDLDVAALDRVVEGPLLPRVPHLVLEPHEDWEKAVLRGANAHGVPIEEGKGQELVVPKGGREALVLRASGEEADRREEGCESVGRSLCVLTSYLSLSLSPYLLPRSAAIGELGCGRRKPRSGKRCL